MKISVITVNYNSKDYLEKMLWSFQKHILSSPKNKHGFEFIIINNEPSLLELPVFEKATPQVIQADHNLGFGTANNLAAKSAFGELLFFLNPDVEFIDDSILDMVDYFSTSSNIGAISPKLFLSSQNRPQPWTCGKKTGILSIFFRNTIGKPWNKDKIAEVDWLSGTALMVKHYDFEKIGGFDENFFMYFEDQDLCLRIKSLGKKVIYYPTTQILHHNGKSWNEKSQQKRHYYQSQDYFFQKHHGKIKQYILKFFKLIFRK
jgi:GT2 family glycosyltransferase